MKSLFFKTYYHTIVHIELASYQQLYIEAERTVPWSPWFWSRSTSCSSWISSLYFPSYYYSWQQVVAEESTEILFDRKEGIKSIPLKPWPFITAVPMHEWCKTATSFLPLQVISWRFWIGETRCGIFTVFSHGPLSTTYCIMDEQFFYWSVWITSFVWCRPAIVTSIWTPIYSLANDPTRGQFVQIKVENTLFLLHWHRHFLSINSSSEVVIFFKLYLLIHFFLLVWMFLTDRFEQSLGLLSSIWFDLKYFLQICIRFRGV